jgi:hypothetical protein
MNHSRLITILIIVLLKLVILISIALGCNITDTDAIAAAKSFCSKMGISFSQEPWVLSTNSSSRYDSFETKEVAYGERGDFKGFITVNCDNSEVNSYMNSELRNRVRKKYRISSITTEPRNWPPFLSEKKAKEKIFSIAKKIGLPSDVEFSQLGNDNENGFWGGNWIRKHNGYPYEKDRISIEIMAVDGEFFSYNKIYHGKPCPTDVKVKKEEAIKDGWQQIERLFSQVDWKKHKKEYVVKSSDLKIVQPNSLAGQIVRRHSKESRLAWVLVYGLKERPSRDKLSEINYLQNIEIKIDAGSRKFLGGDYSR